MQRKKILWLASWYPNRNDRFDGDFIQRHARAAAIYHDVHVIFVTDADDLKPGDEEWNFATGLTEQIIYFRKKKGIGSKIRKQVTWKNIFQRAVGDYIKKNGLPHCVHVHVAWKAGLIALWIKEKFGTNFLVTEHFGFYNKAMENSFFDRRPLVQKLIRKIFTQASVFISVSEFLADKVEMAVGRKVDVIMPNVVDTSLFFYKPEKYSRFSFIHVSNMVYWKNVDKIIEAFKWVRNETGKDVQLILVGNRNQQYVNEVQRSGLLNECIFFRGEVSYKEVAEELRRSHCHILYGNFETFSCVTAESLCSGITVIVPDEGAVKELVHSNNGMIVSSNNNKELARAMIEMIKTYNNYDHDLVAKEASKKYGYSTIAGQFDDLYLNYC